MQNTDINNLLLCLRKFGLTEDLIRFMARDSAFSRRNGKIDPFDFFIHTCLLSTKGSVSFNDLASSIEHHNHTDASRQAYAQRMNEHAQTFFQRVLDALLANSASLKSLFDPDTKLPFARILVQDSTLIPLPLRLAMQFSGAANKNAKSVHARVQCVYDLFCSRFLHFSIDPYSRSDLVAALDTHTQPSDLLLRDRGYFRLEAFLAQSQQKSFFIQRYKHKTNLLDSPDAAKPIELLALLREKGSIDQIVYFPEAPGFAFRIVAFPVPEEVANLRRMKAKKESHGHNPSDELLALMGWTIFITNVLDPAFTPQIIAKLYRLRWRIENIFKTWKSNFRFEKCHAVSAIQLRVLLLARLFLICLYYHQFFVPLWDTVRKRTSRMLSLMKFMRYMQNCPSSVSRFARDTSEKTLSVLVRHCCYDLRRQRSNYMQELEGILKEVEIALA